MGLITRIVDSVKRGLGLPKKKVTPLEGPSRAVLPDYVEYGALATVPAPLECKGTTLYGFFLEADHAKLVALLRDVFHRPSGGAVEYYPLSSHVMATFGVIDRITVKVSPFNTMGTVTEPQVALWIPTAAVRREGGVPIAESFAMFVPYIWLANPISLSSGREDFGWAKSFGRPVLPNEDKDPNVFVALDAFGMDYEKGEQPSFRRLITIREGASGQAAGAAPPEFRSLHDLGGHFARRLWTGERDRDWVIPGLRFVEGALADLVTHRLPEVFLKQFRDIADGKKAALQQIVQTKMHVQRLEGRPLLNDYTVTIDDIDSQPLRDELGLVSQTTSFAFQVEMDFVVETGEVLWQA